MKAFRFLVFILVLLFLSCQISFVRITGSNNTVKEAQTEDIEGDSLQFNGIKKH